MTSKMSKLFAASRGSALVLAGMLVLVSGLTAAAQGTMGLASKERGARSSRSATVRRALC